MNEVIAITGTPIQWGIILTVYFLLGAVVGYFAPKLFRLLRKKK